MNAMDDRRTAESRIMTLIKRVEEEPRQSEGRNQRTLVLFEYCLTRGRMLLHDSNFRHAVIQKLHELAETKSRLDLPGYPSVYGYMAKQYFVRLAHMVKTNEFPRTLL
jgi:hypothetical protein